MRDQSEKLPHEDHEIRSKTVHESYNPATFQNDIALLRLDKPVIYKQHIIPVANKFAHSIWSTEYMNDRASCLTYTLIRSAYHLR